MRRRLYVGDDGADAVGVGGDDGDMVSHSVDGRLLKRLFVEMCTPSLHGEANVRRAAPRGSMYPFVRLNRRSVSLP